MIKNAANILNFMSLRKHIVIALAAILLLTSGAVASAQTTTGSVVSTTSTPGTPNTGAGGDAATNWAILAVTGIVVIGGVAYLLRRPTTSDIQ
jgi:hypothetical protein